MGLELFFSMPFLGGSNSQTFFFSKRLGRYKTLEGLKAGGEKYLLSLLIFLNLHYRGGTVKGLSHDRLVAWVLEDKMSTFFLKWCDLQIISNHRSLLCSICEEKLGGGFNHFLFSSPIWGRFPI